MVTRALSIEDGNLNSPSIITSRKVDYVDIDLAFAARPSGDVYKKTDAAAVKQAVKNLLLTTPGEKPFNPDFGAGLNNLLFELMDDDVEEEISEAIKTAVENYEPRAKILDVSVNGLNDNNTVSVKVVFQIITTNETVTLETKLVKIR